MTHSKDYTSIHTLKYALMNTHRHAYTQATL